MSIENERMNIECFNVKRNILNEKRKGISNKILNIVKKKHKMSTFL